MNADTKGWKTSEFWLALVAQLVALFVASGALPDTHWSMKVAALISGALASMGYSASRGATKAAALKPVDPAELGKNGPAKRAPTKG
jgi:hypothetical protein